MALSARAQGKLKAKGKLALIHTFVYALLIGIIFLIYFPVLRNIADMLKSPNDLIDSSVAFIPKEPSLLRLKQTIEEMQYAQALRNTGLLSLAVGLLQTLICTLTGYGLARYRFPFKNAVFAAVVFTMIVPTQILLPSYYLKFLDIDFFGLLRVFGGQPLKLINQPWPILILALFGVGYKNGLFIFLTRQFFINMPKELDESARIDGAGFIRIFALIMLPSAVPVLVTVFLFGFSWQWTDQVLTAMFMPGQRFFGMAIPSIWDAAHFKGFHDIEITAMTTTAVLLVLLPLLLVYLVFQRFFVQGIERSGLVG